jgi:hypothetical protein
VLTRSFWFELAVDGVVLVELAAADYCLLAPSVEAMGSAALII